MEEIRADKAFYQSEGGVTFSGGEPFCQLEFLMELLKGCRAEGISTAVETNLNYPWATLERTLPLLDLLMVDVKMMDGEKHRKYTGQDNRSILENLEQLCLWEIPVIVRTPLLAGVNDHDKNIEDTIDLLKKFRNLRYYELLRYHTLGLEKFDAIGRSRPVFLPPGEERIEELREKLFSAGIPFWMDGRKNEICGTNSSSARKETVADGS